MSNRTVALTALAVTILGTLYILHSPSTPIYLRLPKMGSSKPSPSSLPLRITLSQISRSPPSLLLTIRNTSPTTTYTILKWDTPLDPQCLNAGIIHLKDLETGKDIEIPKLMKNRLLPAQKGDLEEITPGAEVATELVLSRPWMPERGRFGVWVEGRWRGIWEGEKAAIQEQELQGSGLALEGEKVEFKSEEVVLEVEG